MQKDKQEAKREQFSSSFGFVLALAGSAIGLGNIWKFPYVTGMNGGGAFVFIYLFCICLVGIPIMISELAIGRRTAKNPYGAFAELAGNKRSKIALFLGIVTMLSGVFMILAGHVAFGIVALILGGLNAWFGFKLLGFVQVFVVIIILSYYSVVGGWAISYTIKAFNRELIYDTPEAASLIFNGFITNVGQSLFFQILYIVLCVAVLLRGVKKGIEKCSQVLMPLLVLLLLALIIRNLFLEGAWRGVEFFLKPDFSKITTAGILEALGHAFFTLSLGMGIIVTYGSYLNKKENLFKVSFQTVVFDTVASIMAGLAIFPAVFAMGFNQAAGPRLIFEVLPAAFSKIPGGGFFWCGVFFLVLTIAALTSGISLLEVAIAFLMDQFKMKRKVAIAISSLTVAVLGILSSLSVANWNNLVGFKAKLDKIFGAEYIGGSFFDVLDKISSAWILPLSGLLTALFVGWVWGTRKASMEVRRGSNKIADANLISLMSGLKGTNLYGSSNNRGLTLMTLWALLIRYAIPLIILVIFLHGINVINYVSNLILN